MSEGLCHAHRLLTRKSSSQVASLAAEVEHLKKEQANLQDGVDLLTKEHVDADFQANTLVVLAEDVERSMKEALRWVEAVEVEIWGIKEVEKVVCTMKKVLKETYTLLVFVPT
ncbi:hypothetical protein GUJ93_ZPchr0002g25282 [Zizania palustris]|uniref:Uncharacterized protein n=1 Tax=Zizania palustris TaxID=103762 RepID=A0A8J5RXR3_ZIZPA|nr:hypothetical protein GUJ93_ZPchr0002g25282 [Zizania palustris]